MTQPTNWFFCVSRRGWKIIVISDYVTHDTKNSILNVFFFSLGIINIFIKRDSRKCFWIFHFLIFPLTILKKNWSVVFPVPLSSSWESNLICLLIKISQKFMRIRGVDGDGEMEKGGAGNIAKSHEWFLVNNLASLKSTLPYSFKCHWRRAIN